VSPRPAPPPDLAGRWLSKFFTDHLSGERAASPKTASSYRDAMKLLLTWFRDVERIPPEKLRLADIDRTRVLRFLDWLEAERNCSAATRNQRLAVIKRFAATPPSSSLCPHHPVPHPPRRGNRYLGSLLGASLASQALVVSRPPVVCSYASRLPVQERTGMGND
jgi:integrase